MPIDLYVGGITHATGHLIYFRFFHKFLQDIGWVNTPEPATKLFNHGMVMDAKGEVMSKSKGNVVSPITLMEKHGVDVTRLAMYFTAPSDKEVLWSNEGITGVEKFVLNKFYPLSASFQGTSLDLKRYFKKSDLDDFEWSLYVKLNQTIKKVSESIERLQFNTAIAALMELTRDYAPTKVKSLVFNDYLILKAVQLIGPMAPHLSEELWHLAGHTESVFKSDWPRFDPDAIVADTIEIAVQVNGKLRDSIRVAADADQAEVERTAGQSSRVNSFLDGKTVVKKIYVPGRILNIVVKG